MWHRWLKVIGHPRGGLSQRERHSICSDLWRKAKVLKILALKTEQPWQFSAIKEQWWLEAPLPTRPDPAQSAGSQSTTQRACFPPGGGKWRSRTHGLRLGLVGLFQGRMFSHSNFPVTPPRPPPTPDWLPNPPDQNPHHTPHDEGGWGGGGCARHLSRQELSVCHLEPTLLTFSLPTG